MSVLTSALEVVASVGLVLLGVLMFVSMARPRRRHRYDVLALLLAIVALVEASRARDRH